MRIIHLIVAALLLCATPALAQTPTTPTLIQAQINAEILSCGTGCISGSDLNSILNRMAVSYGGLTVPNTWSGAQTLSVNPVLSSCAGVILGQSSSPITCAGYGTYGYALTSQGAGAAPIWSPLAIFPTLLQSGVNAVTWGVDPVVNGDSIIFTTAPVREGGILTLTTDEGNKSSDEFLHTIMSSEVATPTYTGTTNASTSTSSNVLHFATNPAGILVGMSVSDQTSGALTGGQTITNIAAGAVTISSNANATVNSGDLIAFGYPNFKGPLFLSTESADYSTSNFVRASNGLTIYSGVKNGATNGYAEGIVDVTQENGTGQGVLISGEFDISPTSAANGAHCDASGLSACHTNIWMANFGTKAGSWMIDTGAGGAGWNNGISIRNITGGGPALLIPNGVAIVSENAANTAYVDLAFADASSNAVYGYGANSAVIASHMASIAGTGAAPAVSSCGTSPSLAAGSTDTKGVITVGSGTVNSCTLSFHTNYAGAPACVLTGTNAAAPLAFGAAPVVSGFYFNSGANNIAGQQVSYICMQ